MKMKNVIAGFGRFGCLALVSFVMLWGGGQGVYTWATNRQPVAMSCQDFVGAKPRAKWLRLTGCEVDLLGASYKQSIGGRIKEAYLPVRPPGEEDGAALHVLLSTRDDAMLSLLARMADIEEEKELLQFMLENRETLRQTRDVEGLMQFGIDLTSEDRAKLAGLDDSLAEDFAILAEGEKPGLGQSLAFLGFGVLVMLGGAVLLAGSGADRTSKG